MIVLEMYGFGWNSGIWCSVRTIDVYCPNCPVVSVVGPETLSIVREPDVDDVVFGTGKEEIALLIEFYLS